MIDAATFSTDRTRRATVFALTVVLLDSVGFGLILPVLPSLIEEVGGIDLDGAARVGGFLFALFSLAQFAFAPLVGTLSDRIGRRPPLLVAIAGLGVDYVVQAVAPSLIWLCVGRLVAGICGSSYVIANACLADVCPPEKRARAFGLMSAAFGLGFVLGPALGGLLGAFGTRVPFWCAAGLATANLLFGLVGLPETLAPENRRRFEWRQANPFGAFVVFRRFPGVLPLGAVTAVYFFGSSIYVAIWPFWGIAKFGWSPTLVGATLAASGLAMALLQGLATGPAVTRWGEKRLAQAGLAIAAACCLAYGLTSHTVVVFGLLVIHAAEGFVHPMVTAMMSRAVPENAQGGLQGGLAAVTNLAMLAGTVFFTQVFGRFLTATGPIHGPDVAFFIAATVIGLALVGFLRATRAPT
jgi:DHA1 family tetracycline resistance protein-like MFS transporter